MANQSTDNSPVIVGDYTFEVGRKHMKKPQYFSGLVISIAILAAVLFVSGCQSGETISGLPILTSAVPASPVKSPVPEAVVGEPTIIGSPEIMETFPIKSPLPEPTSAPKIAPTSTAPAASNAEPIVSLSSTPTSSPPQPTPTYTPYHPPTRVPIETIIHSVAETDVRAEQDWLTYTDSISGLSFQYPPDWEIFESKPGIFVRFLHNERGHFIHVTIRENPDNLLPLEYLVDEILQSRIKFTRSTLLPEIKQFSGGGFNGAVYQETDSNVATRMILNYEGVTVRLSLRIRGTVGGFPMPSNDYSGTEQEIFELVNSLQISTTVASLPTVVSIASQDVTTVDTLSGGRKIVYSETDDTKTKFWMSNVLQLDKRTLLAEIGPHKSGYGSGGQVSPDGSKIAYTFIPPGFSPKDITQIGYEVWILDITSRASMKIAEKVNGFVKWLPDSQALIYSREKHNDNGEVEINIYSIFIDNQQEKLISSTNDYFKPAGFLDNWTLLFLKGKDKASTEVHTLDLLTGEAKYLQTIDVAQPWERYNISPDGKTILITKSDTLSTGKKYELILVSLATGEKQTILTYPYDQAANEQPIQRFVAQWLPDSQHLLIRFPIEAEQPPRLEVVDTNARNPSYLLLSDSTFLTPDNSEPDALLLPGLWSSDGKWLTLMQYPKPSQEVYVLEIETNKMIRIPNTEPPHSINVVGWSENN